MSSSRPTLAATNREVTGKKVAAMRRAGRLPAVVFGHGHASQSLSLDSHDFELLQRRIGQNALVDLAVDGKKATPVLIQNVQRDPVYRRMLHVDLFAVRMTEELTVDVPLVFVGESYAIEKLGGTLLHMIESVKIRALPDHLPQAIEVPIDGLADFEAAVHVRDLTIPADATLLTDLDETVARVQQPRVEEVEAPVEGVGEGAPEEEAAEDEAAGSGPDEGGSTED